MENMYDVIVIGQGPAGLSAGLYAARAKMSVLILEKDKTGGQIVITHEVANYPGSIENATGPSLIARMVEQCEEFGAKRVKENVTDVNFDEKIKTVTTENNTYKAKTVIIATGASPRKIGCPGEKELTGKGVTYCATCDADFFTDLEVYCIGGGDTALEEAMFITKFARKVNIVHRRDEFRAAKSIVEKAEKNEKINFIFNSTVEEIKGDGIVESIVLKDTVTGELKEHFADEEDGTFGVFVFVGYTPQTSIFDGKIKLENGYIPTDDNMNTDKEGVYAAGDVRVKTLRQVVTATADGAIASVMAEKYIESNFED